MRVTLAQCMAVLSLSFAMSATLSCSTKRVPAPPETLKDLSRVSKVYVAQYHPDKFKIFLGEAKARSAGLMMFGAIGGAIEGGMQVADAEEEGAKFISASQLMDPIATVESRFLKAWQREAGVKELASAVDVLDDSPAALKKKFGNGFLLDFRTLSWLVQPMPEAGFSSPTSYRPIYKASVRLVDLDAQTVPWEGTCEYDRDSGLTSNLTRADLNAIDGGAAVRTAMNTLAEACGDWL